MADDIKQPPDQPEEPDETSSAEESEKTEEQPGLFKRLVRVELIVTLFLLAVLGTAYGYFFLDSNLKWAAEFVGGRAIGSEVNLEELRTGWLQPGIKLEGFRITDLRKPNQNWIEVGQVEAGINLDALLRGNIVIETATVDGLAFRTDRESKGWVMKGGGDLQWLYDYSTDMFSAQFQTAASDNVFGDALTVLEGKSPEETWQSVQSELASDEVVDEVETELSSSRDSLRKNIESLPDNQEINSLQDKLSEIKKLIDEDPVEAISEINKTKKRIEDYSDTFSRVSKQVSSTLDSLESLKQRTKSAVQSDREDLRGRFTLPDMDFQNPTKSIFMGFLEERAGSLHGIFKRVEPYVFSSEEMSQPSETGESSQQSSQATETDPAGGSDAQSGDTESSAEPERAEPVTGRDYQFHTSVSYPSFWLKQGRISGTTHGGEGSEISAAVNNLVSDPGLISQELSGTFEVNSNRGTFGKLLGEFRKPDGLGKPLEFSLTGSEWDVRNWVMLDGSGLTLTLSRGTGILEISGQYRPDFLSTEVQLVISGVEFDVQSPDETMRNLVTNVLSDMDAVEVTAKAAGPPSDLDWTVDSNFGSDLIQGMNRELRDRVEAYRNQLEQKFNAHAEQLRGKVNQRVDELRNKFQQQLNQPKQRLEELRKSYEQELETAKKKKQNELKDKAEEELKNLLD